MRLAGCIVRGLAIARAPWAHVGRYAKDLQAVEDTLKPHTNVTGEERETQFMVLRQQWQSSAAPIEQHFAKMMRSFEPGLFVGGEAADVPVDNLDLERWFKGPKGPERRMHGRRHAGVRIVRQGPTLMPLPFCGQREALQGQSGPDGGSRSASFLRLTDRPRPLPRT